MKDLSTNTQAGRKMARERFEFYFGTLKESGNEEWWMTRYGVFTIGWDEAIKKAKQETK